jgi:cytochrome c oxidase assembly protein subunit 15
MPPAPVAGSATATGRAGEGRGLHAYALLVAVCTGVLVFAGGLVTSTGSGLAVPDWPLSYGEIMPPMVGNVRFEHGHRMVATAVGLLTIGLAGWLWRRDRRPAVRKLGIAALGAVVVQGLLGGLTVLLLLPAPISVAHAAVGQTFFCIVVSLALFTSPGWREPVRRPGEPAGGIPIRTLALVTLATVYVQLVLGAAMRHTGAGLAIPDFPLAFGRIIPSFGAPGVAIHFAHRVGALLVAASAALTVARVLRNHRSEPALVRPAILLAALVVVQIVLGATTVWSRKAAIPTTLHVLNGALVLATSLVLVLRAHKHVAREPRSMAYGPLRVGSVAT